MLSKTNKMLVVTGGGVRVRHILDLGIDLGMPTGVLAQLASKISEQNAEMVSLLLSKWGGNEWTVAIFSNCRPCCGSACCP